MPFKLSFQKIVGSPTLTKAIQELGFKEPTEIQRHMIPKAKAGRNIVASAETGTGKTAAYSIPLLHKLNIIKKSTSSTPLTGPFSLILAPTKELCQQVKFNIDNLAKHEENQINSSCIFGSVDEKNQIKALEKSSIDILVATPGRLLHLAKNKNINLSKISTFIVDECDKMLNMGFLPDVMEIWEYLPRQKKRNFKNKLKHTAPDEYAAWKIQNKLQTILLSATLQDKVENFVTRLAPIHTRIDLNKSLSVPSGISHIAYSVTARRKKALLLYFLRRKKSPIFGKQILLFARTQQRCDRLVEDLKKFKFKVGAVHRDKSVNQRTEVLDQFLNNKIQILVSTDVMTRGIDIPNLPIVLNFDIPPIPEEYIHRIGRTGRAGNEGLGISFVANNTQYSKVGKRLVEMNESEYFKKIESKIGKKINFNEIQGSWKPDSEVPGENVPIWLQKAKNETVNKILENRKLDGKISKKTSEDIPTGKLYSAMKQRTNARQNVFSQKYLKEKFTPELRNFSEGRYEQVVSNFDSKRAEKRGIDLTSIKEEKEKEKEKERKEKGKKIETFHSKKTIKTFKQKKSTETLNQKKKVENINQKNIFGTFKPKKKL